ncbi:MAG: pre-toxin TG domain-containing protein [Bdellovibrio sp.]
MKKLIQLLVMMAFSINSFATYWEPNQEIPIEIDTNSPSGAEFQLGVPTTTQYQEGQIYYFRDNEGNMYQGIFAGGDGKNSRWSHMSLVPGEMPAASTPGPTSNTGYFSSGIHTQAMGSAITIGIAHAVYQTVIFDNTFTGEIEKLNAQNQANQQAIYDNYKKIRSGIASARLTSGANIEAFSKDLQMIIESSPGDISNKYSSQDSQLIENLKQLETIFRLNYSTSPKRIAARSWGLNMLTQSDSASVRGDSLEAQAFLKYAEAFADLAIGLDPITGPIRDTYEAFTGRNLVTGEILDNWSRGFAIVGAVTFGFGSKISKGIKVFRTSTHIVESERAVVKAIEIDAHISKRIEAGVSPRNRATYEKMLTDLRKQMARPIVEDSNLKKFITNYWREGSTVGNGSTAAAYRWERLTNERVGDKLHTQKLKESVTFLNNWIRNNPNASRNDITAAENIIKDALSALGGN